MQKEYLIKNIHCADCARVLGEAISKIDGVVGANINFVRQKFSLEINDEYNFEEVFEKVNKVIKDFSTKVVLEDLNAKSTMENVKNYSFIVKNLNCANCANALVEDLLKLNGVKNVSMNFAVEKMFIEIDESIITINQVKEHIKAKEPNSIITDSVSKVRRKFDISLFLVVVGLMLGVATFFINIGTVYYWCTLVASVVLIGHQTYLTALRLLKRGVVNENLLVTISVFGAIAVNEAREGLMVVGLYTIGKMLEAMAVNKSRKSIQSLVEIQPEYANLIEDDVQKKVAPNEVKIGSKIVIKQGERVPLDSIIVNGCAMLDQKHLTGESMPVSVGVGEEIASGSIVLDGVIEAQTIKEYNESTVARILSLIEDASEKKSKTETFISKFSKFYTLGVIVLAISVGLVVGLVTKDLNLAVYRGLIFLVVSCPCAFAISVPLTYFSGIGNASKLGILIKGSNYLDASAKIKTVAFDKTGTLTKGQFEVIEVDSLNENYSMIDILKFACWAEQYSTHPIAKAIMKYGEDVKLREVENFREVAGEGVGYTLSGLEIFVGMATRDEESIYTQVFIKVDDEIIGKISLADGIKESAHQTILRLKAMGIKTVMLSGDSNSVAKATAEEISLDEFYGGLKPEDKYLWIESHKNDKEKLAYVGDGINDAPSLAIADIGVSMGIGGSASSIEASDVVLSDDNPERVADLIDLSKHTKKIVVQNIAFAGLVKLTFLILSGLGITGMLFAVFADVGVTLIAIFNSMRALFYKTKEN